MIKNMKMSKLKRQHLVYLLLALTLLATPINSQSCKMPGMTYNAFHSNLGSFSAKGTARNSNNILSISWREGQGALWNINPVVIHPRFELRTKVVINRRGCGDPGSPWIDGFTIIFSKTKDYLGPGGGALGYNGIYDALVTEIDLFQNPGDISFNSVSIHRCYKDYCMWNEGPNTFQANLPFAYDKCREMVYDVYMQYRDGLLNVFVNDSHIISSNENLLDKFDGFAYFGFSGSFWGYQRELLITPESYWCVDQIQNIYFDTKFTDMIYYGNKVPSNIPAGAPIEIIAKFSDIEGLFIPHLYGQNVTSWKLTIGYDCGLSVFNWKSFIYIDRIQIQNLFYDCTKAGQFLVLFSLNGGPNQNYYGSIISRGYESLRILGNNGLVLDAAKISREVNGQRFINWGIINGDFLTDQTYSRIAIDLFPSDSFGNYFNLGDNFNQLLQDSLMKVSRNGSPVSFTFRKKPDNNYEFTMPIDVPGDYRIENIKFPQSKPYFLRVLPGNIAPQRSSCQISNDLSRGVIDNKVTVTYTCTLFDKFGNAVDLEMLQNNGQLKRSCTVWRGNDVNSYVKLLEINSVTNKNQNGFTCAFDTQGNGNYKIHAFFVMGNSLFENSQQLVQLNTSINEFKVISTPQNFNASKIFDFTQNKFINSGPEEVNNISFTADNNVPLTLISLADESGAESANIGYGPNFTLTDFSGSFTNSHAPTIRPITSLKFELYTLPANGRQYVAVSFANQSSVLIRNSFHFLLALKYKNSILNIRVFYAVLASYGQTVCIHDLKVENTVLTTKDLVSLAFKNNDYVNILTMRLRTSDNNLFNSFIASSRITYRLTPSVESTKVIISQDPAVAGFYNVFVQGVIMNDYKLDILVDSFTALSQFAFSILPQSIINTMTMSGNNKYKDSTVSETTGRTLDDTSADEAPIVQFTALDLYKNVLSISPNSANSFLGISLEISVNDSRIVERIDSSAVKFFYNATAFAYQLEDYIKVPGNYLVKITSAQGKLLFNYYKRPGLASASNSIAVLNSPNSIKLTELVFVGLNLRDKSNNLISIDNNLLTSELNKIKVYALHEDNVTKVNLTLNPNPGTMLIYSGSIGEKAGKYSIKVEYANPNVPIINFNCNSCIMEANYEQFDINKCKLYIVTSKNELLTQDLIKNINNVNDIPLFNFLFFDASGKQLNFVNNKSNLKAFITGANNFRLNLNIEWIKSYQILWTMPEDNVSEDQKFKNLKGDNYILNIAYNEAIALKYTLKLLGDGKDEDAGNGAADISKTYFNEANINSIAGVTYSTNIEFRTVDNLRVNFYEDLTNFSFKNSENLDSKKFNVIAQKGPKKGTYILAIYTEVAFLPSAPLLLTISFKSVEIPQKMRIAVKHSDLASIEVLPENIKNSAELTLRDCSVDNENLFYLQAYDKFKNIFLDIYDASIYSVNRIKSLFDVQHADKFQIILNAGTSFQKDKFFISVIARNKGLVNFTSTFLANQIWKISFSPGAFDALVSYGVVTPTKLISGESITFNVYLRDKYNNVINVANASTVYDATKVIAKRNGLNIDKPLAKSLDSAKNAFAFGFQALLKGTYNFFPVFGDSAIRCDNCQAIVLNSNYVFGKSALFYVSSSSSAAQSTSQRLIANNPFELSKTILPTFGLNLFDVNENIYDLIPEEFALAAQLLLPSGQIAVDLCTEKNNQFINIFICRDTKSRNNWKFLLNGSYTLKIEDKSVKANEKDKFLTYSISVVNGAMDPNASNGEVDISKTVFGVAELKTVAGESGQFTVEIRTIENKRKYAWEDEPAKYILLSFAKNLENNYTVDVNLGEMPGQYVVKIVSKKAFTTLENNFISFKINGVDLLNRVKLVTIPNLPTYSNFVDAKGDKVLTLPSGFADDVYESKLRIFDKHDNLITPKLSDVNFTVAPPAEKSNVSIISNFNINQDSSVSIYINAIFAGEYSLRSSLFAEAKFTVLPGLPSSNNSLAIAENEVTAGATVKLYVIPYDKNNNLIDPQNTGTKEPFKASLKYKVKDEYVPYLDLADAAIENFEYPKASKKFMKAFAFTTQLKFKGQNFFRVMFSSSEIKCVNCITNVLAAEPIFSFFLFSYFDSNKGQFSELVDNTAFDNSKTEPIIRLFPRDKFQNLISVIKNFDRYALIFTEKKNTQIIYKFKVSNSDDGKQEYIEFKQNDEFAVNKDLFFKTLTKGEYILSITEDNNVTSKKLINVFLLGTDSDADASNDALDISKTVITDSNLEFTAGLDGRLIIELRTVSNMRKNNWFYKVDVQPRLEDKSFTRKIINATKLGQYLVTFGSTKANTFPTYFDYGLKITIDGQEVKALNPLVKINPDIMAKSFIVDSFLKAPGAKEIQDGNSDKNLAFSIQSKDKFDNISRVNTELLKLSVTGPDGNLVIYTSDGQYSASLGFTADTRKAGSYTLTGNTLPSYTYSSAPGALNFDNSIVYNANVKIIAGQSAAVVVIPKDKNSNVIEPSKVLEAMRVSVKTPNKILELVSAGSADSKKATFALKLEEKGINKWTILIDKKLKACESCFTEVAPDAPSAEKSVIYLLDEVNNSKINYANNSEIRISNKFPINFFVSLRDKFENLIESISGNSSVLSPFFSGLDIAPINLSISRTTDNSQFWLRIPQESHRLFNHLISGRNYALKFSVKDEVNVQEFNFPINILSDRDDSEAGNGDYVIENTYLSETALDLYADTRKTFIMRLKTAKKLFYNDDIDIENYVKYTVEPSDETFQFKVSRDFTKYNYYSISVFSRKSIVDAKLSLTISLRDPVNKANFKSIPQKVNLVIKPKMPPFAPKTKIISMPKENENLAPMESITISFNLFDEYGNIYSKNTDVLKFLKFINNDKDVDIEKEKVVIQLKNDGTTYEATFAPLYPPKFVNFYLNYLDTESKIMLNVLNTTIKRNILSVPDYKSTKISGDNINIMKAGEKVNLFVDFYDKFNACVEIENEITIVGKIRGPLNNADLSLQKTFTYNFKKNVISDAFAECKSNFKMEVPIEGIYTIAGEYEITVFVGSQQYKLQPIIQKLIPGDLDVTKTITKYTDEFAFKNNKFKAGENFNFIITGFDKFMNQITSSLKNFSVKLINKTSSQALKKDIDFRLRLQDEKIGQLSGYATIFKSGLYTIQYNFNGELVDLNASNGPKEISILPNICSNKISENAEIKKIDTAKLDKAIAGEPTFFRVFCYDEFNNKVNTGGEAFLAKIQLKMENGKSTEVNSKVLDNQDGSYKFDFTPPLKGKYDIKILLNNEEFISLTDKEIGDLSCPKETPFRCTNDVEKCVKELKDCVAQDPDFKCDSAEKPIGCLVNGTKTCVQSKTDCDCPKSANDADPYVKCESSKTCVFKSKFDSMCFDPLLIDCARKFPSFPVFNADGICRFKGESPSQRVCPLGFLLCPDLTCRQSITECQVYEDCKSDEIRCSDMTCVKDQKDCPSTIVCPLAGQFVCPDGECVFSELACKRLPLCDKAYPFLCSQNVCADNKSNCPKSISCGHGKALCGDMICRSSCRN